MLGFVARRLSPIPVGLLAASRTGEDSFLGQAGLPTLLVPQLTDTAAHALLASRYPAMAPRVRQRLLTEAQGNPLALLELPAALLEHTAATGAGSALPAVLPLSRRLHEMFAARLQPLPPQTRHLLLAAVLDGTGDLATLDAVAGSPAADALAPAERAGLIRVDRGGGRVTFRHPLIRSAVADLAAADDRRAVHRTLAAHHSGQDARRAWHLAEAAAGPDEDVAALLQGVAHVNLWRGDSVGAIGELLRAAELSPAGADRALGGVIFLFVAFLQITLGYTALQAGLVRWVGNGSRCAERSLDPDAGGRQLGLRCAHGHVTVRHPDMCGGGRDSQGEVAVTGVDPCHQQQPGAGQDGPRRQRDPRADAPRDRP